MNLELTQKEREELLEVMGKAVEYSMLLQFNPYLVRRFINLLSLIPDGKVVITSEKKALEEPIGYIYREKNENETQEDNNGE